MLKRLTWCTALVATVTAVAAGGACGQGANETGPGHVKPAGGPDHIQRRIRAGEVPVRGANLGGWLVSEKWMTAEADIWKGVPKELEGGGEFVALTQASDPATRLSSFKYHHDSFVTEKDIEDIAKAGLNTVRVPVGYWIVGQDPYDTSKNGDWSKYPKDTVKYLDVLIKDWAVKHNVAVLVSIHGAKGSQNGADHSAPVEPGKCYWSKFKENVDNTINMAKFLGDRYKDEVAFLGIGLLNEPNGDTDEKVLNQYYEDAYKAVRASGNDCILTIMPLLYKQDAENLNGFMEAPAYKNVWVEWHPYFIWGYAGQEADEIVSKSISKDFQEKLNKWNNRPNSNKLFFGEWSLANTGQFPNGDSPDFERWTQAQSTVMDQAKGGWTYWSWRLYGDETGFNAWSMRSVLRKDSLKKILIK
ncbi:hypothetical protein Poli38472_011999 [Pythium oligandrum]|uniref:glucan 1,3-beta-glucosidase n=1 Tax=Pythium oligandrum TaxID=41045 RepID=A0A8K1FQS7_PYTOL|nr:hypothetical protein Poli38472_011999 [Pythium oligandrum]|eukprot:TMW66883.1 hypothetical protein Poli38472_011999 [Pythium oligandrum]